MPDPVKGRECQQGTRGKNESQQVELQFLESKALVSAAFVPDRCRHLDGDDRGEVSGSEAPAAQEADTARVTAHREVFGLGDKGTCVPSLPCSTGSCTRGCPAPCQECLITLRVILEDP